MSKELSSSDKVRILSCAGDAARELDSGNFTKAHSFASLVRQYTGKRYSLEQIEEVLKMTISDIAKLV